MTGKVLVIGGTGMLGEPVARQLQANGHAVRILTRSPAKAQARFGSQFEVAGGDVEDPAALEAALQGCQGVHINLQDLFDVDLERRGAEKVAHAAAKTGIERITYLSGASVCAENCWYPGTHAKFQAEAALQASGIPYTIFRDNYLMEVLPKLVRGGLALNIGKHRNPYSWIAAADYARMVAKAYDVPETVNKILFICGPERLSMTQALETYRRIVHPKARTINLSLRTTRLIARLGRRKELLGILPFFEYCETVEFSEHPEEANALLGAPATTVEAWSRQNSHILL
jgi:uncharacterized protein YbjT (DUF2867 family)